jgi:nitrogen PTS system EIIA component
LRLASLISPHHIVIGLQARTLTDAIRELLDHCHTPSADLSPERVTEEVLRREAQCTTALAGGVALPHARISGFGGFHIYLGIPCAPLETPCMDGSPVEVLFLIIAGESKHTVMLQSMAAISRFGSDSANLEALRSARTRDEAVGLLEERGGAVKRVLHTRDLMRTTYVSAIPSMPLRDLLDLMFETRIMEVAVLNANESVVGSVTSAEIIEAGFPKYMSTLRDLSFLSEFEPFDQFFKREADTTVNEIMNRHPLVAAADDPVIQVVFRMKQEHQSVAFVQEQNRFVGTIHRDDIIVKILRA